MTKKIFQSIALVAALVFTASVVLIMGVLYTHFLNVQFGQMQAQADLAVQGISESGLDYTDGLKTEGYRLTWIDTDGQVLYDSAAEAETMENHLQREEVQQAIKSGEGRSTRYSTTLLQRQLYVAVKVSDGTIVRIADSQHSILGLLLGMLKQILIMAAVALAISLLLAYRLSSRITRPLNEINLDNPNKKDIYTELHPLIDRLIVQQNQIKTQSQKLRQKQKEFDASTANMQEGLLIVGQERQIISMNRAAAQILQSPPLVSGKTLDNLTKSEEIEMAFQEGLCGKTVEIDMEFSGKQYQLHASPVKSAGQITAVVIFMLDVSAKMRTEQLRREFTANVSHELKTPLQTISGSAELIAEGMVKPEDVSTFGRRIYDEASRLVSLIDDIIGLSRLDEGTEDMYMEEVDLCAVAEHTAAGLSEVAAKAGVKVSFSGESAMVMGDFAMLGSIVYNLCENAIKYSREDGEVSVSVRKEDAEVMLTVKDNGIGIPEEDRERIFERFYRVDKARSKEVGGTGLGLSIVKHAVSLHNGRIELTSKLGEGTSITVYLPKAKVH